METLDKMPFTDKNPAFVELIDLATYENMSEDEQVAYDHSLKRMWDYDNMIRGEREYAMAEGKAEGFREIARNMKNLGLPIDIIIQASGLTKEQIEAL